MIEERGRRGLSENSTNIYYSTNMHYSPNINNFKIYSTWNKYMLLHKMISRPRNCHVFDSNPSRKTDACAHTNM